ncbi:LOW QUALITY PROTEIN: UBN2_3 domain-containing protein, partial [Cephalotus follicularis]
DPAQPITIILDGPNYLRWSSAMTSFLKERKLWSIVTGDKPAPVKRPDETDDSFADRLEDWDSANHRILTWFTNTSVPVNMHFSRFDLAKEAWDFLASRYTFADLAHYQLVSTLNRLCQESGQSIDEFHSQVSFYWGLLAVSEPKWHCQEDHTLFTAYRDKLRLTQFLMALRDDFEPTRASILNRQSLLSLETALSERSRCTHCHRIGHIVKTCYDIVGRPPGKSTGLKIAAATTTAPSGSESSSQIHQLSTADLEALLNQVMSRTGSSAMSATSGNT